MVGLINLATCQAKHSYCHGGGGGGSGGSGLRQVRPPPPSLQRRAASRLSPIKAIYLASKCGTATDDYFTLAILWHFVCTLVLVNGIKAIKFKLN